MKLLFLSCLVGCALATPSVYNGAYNYFEKTGIPLADRIRAEKPGPGSRVSGGSAAILGELPFMCGQVITLTTGFTAVCGATLLTPTKLVTAAHCSWDGRNRAQSIEVVLGSLALFEETSENPGGEENSSPGTEDDGTSEASTGVRTIATRVERHESYDPGTAVNDVAMLTIDAVTFDENIGAAFLPTGTLLNNNYIGMQVVSAGWGITAADSPIEDDQVLQKVDLRVVALDFCRQIYGNKITAQHLCVTGDSGRNICNGDTGGPLVVPYLSGHALIGMASFTHYEDCDYVPAVFTRADSFLTWIIGKMYQ